MEEDIKVQNAGLTPALFYPSAPNVVGAPSLQREGVRVK